MQLSPLPYWLLTQELRPLRTWDLEPLGSAACTVTPCARPRPLPQGFKYASWDVISHATSSLSVHKMAPYSLLVTRLQVSELRALWVHGGGVPPSLPAAVGEARQARPAVTFCVPVSAWGPASCPVVRRPRSRRPRSVSSPSTVPAPREV